MTTPASDGNGQAPPTILPPSVLPPVTGGDEGADPRLMTYTEHLEELRGRIIKSAIGLGVAMALSFAFTWNIIEFLKQPASDARFIFTEPTEALSTFMQVGFISGVVLSTPVWLYQLVMFIAPGLTRKERRYLFSALPAVLCCFAIGVAFAYFVVAPPMVNFMFHFGEQVAEQFVRLGRYVSFIANLLFLIGVTFETPLIIFVLARLGIVTPALLTRFRRYAIVLAFVLGAVITPTPDPLNQSVVAVPIILLYELGILLSRLAVRQRERDTA